MGLSIYSIERMGFVKIPEGKIINAVFNSILVYRLNGITLNDLSSENLKQMSYQSNDFSFCLGNSINEVSKYLLNDTFIDDENEWIKDKKVTPPFILIHFKKSDIFTCSEGYWKNESDHIITYDCFGEAKKLLKELEDKILPNLISALTIHLSKFNKSVRLSLVSRDVFAKTQDAQLLYDINIKFTGSLSVSKNVTPLNIKSVIDDSISMYSNFNNKVGSLFFSAIDEKNKFKQFLNFFQALEIYTHLVFKRINFDAYISKQSNIPNRIKDNYGNFLIKQQSEIKQLFHRFLWCAVVEWENLTDSDINSFKRIKKLRDEISHGEIISESDLPVKDIEELILKILLKL